MNTPDFWIKNLKGDPDRVILTPSQIADLNRKNRTKAYRFTDINGKEYSLLGKNSYLVDDPLSIVSIPGDSVRAVMEQRLKSFERGTSYDFRHKAVDDAAKRKIIEKTRYTQIPSTITPRYGILVCASQNMKYPTAEEFCRNRTAGFRTTPFPPSMPRARWRCSMSPRGTTGIMSGARSISAGFPRPMWRPVPPGRLAAS